MGNTKHRKKHKQKLKARKNQILQDKNRMKKMQQEFFMNLINKEKEKGMFNENPVIAPVTPIEGPSI